MRNIGACYFRTQQCAKKPSTIMKTITFQPASERTNNTFHTMNSHNLLIFHP
ncbi:hypothetical protein ADIAG_04071 [Paeniglutamicibacter gangotriensis Lz1y]|uniref:Uncharacterized protein n=1 Tax=Paeniglutamicibacter gangotriensis Lz1y TaxID=1276920 RepID=M7MNS5_9MICC|nr:hypothetical protein ADIAG_04071 [Paeniglutamicibacter gangotriensis Lz1y]